MSESEIKSQHSPAASAVLILVTALLGFVVLGPIIGFFIALPFYDGTFFDFVHKLEKPLAFPEVKVPYLIMQASATFFGLIVGPLLFWIRMEKRKLQDLGNAKTISIAILALTALVVVAFMGPNSLLIEWNANVTLPDALKGWENSARQWETRAEELTRFFTTMNSAWDLCFVLIVVAIIPAVGEELVFRGMLQSTLQRATRNPHAAVWISAILFSALHMQFFGFVPRMLLGALFGYLYLWSGNLIIPMFAHFINNALSVVLLFLQQHGQLDLDPNSTDAAPWPMVIIGAIITFGLLAYLKKLFDRHSIPS